MLVPKSNVWVDSMEQIIQNTFVFSVGQDWTSYICYERLEPSICTMCLGYNIKKHKSIDLDSLECSIEANTPSTDTSTRL